MFDDEISIILIYIISYAGFAVDFETRCEYSGSVL